MVRVSRRARISGQGADGFDARDQPLAVSFPQGEFHFPHDGIVFAGNVRFDGEVRHGGLLVRRNGYVYVGKLDAQTAGPRTGQQGQLSQFFTIQGIVLAEFWYIHVQLDSGGEKAGYPARGPQPRQVAFIGRR